MPKGFTEDGQMILTKEEFMARMLKPRGYMKDANGNWFLPDTLKTTKCMSKKTTKTKAPSKKIGGEGLNKDIILRELKKILKNYKPIVDKASITFTYNEDRYEFKVVKKTTEFNFIDQDIKDNGKRRIINEVLKSSICEIGMIDGSSVIGFTDNNQYFSATLIKKRK